MLSSQTPPVPQPQPLRAGAIQAALRRNRSTTGAVLRKVAPEVCGRTPPLPLRGRGEEPCAAPAAPPSPLPWDAGI